MNRRLKYPSIVSVVCCLLFFLPLIALSQEQKIADSLAKIYEQNASLTNSDKLELLRNLSFNETDLSKSLQYAEALIALSTAERNYLYLHRGYFQKGNKHRLAGDMNKSLDAFFKSSEAAIKAKYIVGEGTSYSSIADVYSTMGNSKNAQTYYARAIALLRKGGNDITLASSLLNAGDEYLKDKKFDTALEYFEESGAIFKKADYLPGTAYNLGNIGMVYAEQGKDDLAMDYIGRAIQILEKLEDYYAISDYLTYMADIYRKKGNFTKALGYANRSLELAQKYGLKDQVSKSNLKLSELYESMGNTAAAFKFYKDHITYRDSVSNLQTIQQMADLRTNYEVSQKQVQVNLLKKDAEIQQLKSKRQRNLIYATVLSFALILVVAMGVYRRYTFVKRTNRIIEEERNTSDRLLRNILPDETAHELKQNGKVKAKKFESVTVLFTDFEGFTKYAENLPPEKLVESVDYYFSHFDTIMEKYGIEKIKTVGDAYMCVAGLPFERPDHACKMVLAAIEILEFVENSHRFPTKDQTRFRARIGLNSGAVVAGIVGTKKFAYDIWGDTVNIASRMESCSEPGKINISETTFDLVKDHFTCTYRGEIAVKNRGNLKMYFVDVDRAAHSGLNPDVAAKQLTAS